MNIQVTSWNESEADIRTVRNRVFVQEQMIPLALEWDGNDPCSTHVVAYDRGGNAVGTGRIQCDGRIGRLVVLKPFRGLEIGAKLLNALIELADLQNLKKIYLHAQLYAIPFYEKSGFKQDGPAFLEDGIHHVNMRRNTRQ
jgi:predicted GNAT family N-acyltransferase